ncbi:MAG: S41 family peptidase [Bacteroidia bacterium]|nr:S41 family peptidase [Bacteroidia bacterium]
MAIILFSCLGFRSSEVSNYFEISKNIDLLGQIIREISNHFVDEIDIEKFIRIGIDASLASLDPYTNFIDTDEIEDFKYLSTGQYGGIGAGLNTIDGKNIISEVYPGKPAHKAGLKAGDVIIKIDNTLIENKKMDNLQVRNLLRGQPHTKVIVTVKRYGESKPLTFTVEREEIKIENVPYYGMLNSTVGYINLSQFTQDASHEVKKAYEELKKRGMQSLILDLRSNPGGLLFEAINVSNLFVNKGEKIVETKGRIEGANKIYSTENSPLDLNIPLVVLINGQSASASEIVAGVMQDLDRGVVIGQRSFGKGLVQTTSNLPFKTQLKITTSRYHTPSGRCIQSIDYTKRTYAKKNKNAKQTKTPDSLKAVFYTRAGRKVYDAGGIDPDVPLKPREYHKITLELVRKNLIYNYATEFYYKNPKIAPPREFKITDAIYQDFLSFLEKNGFKYEDHQLKEMEEVMAEFKREEFSAAVQNSIEALKKEWEAQKKQDLVNYREEIAEWLTAEIVSRYYYRAGRIEAALFFDPEVKEAITLLQDPNRYQKLLTATK